jgi:hypothetical protein
MKPKAAKPRVIMAQVEGFGTADIHPHHTGQRWVAI